MTCGGNPPPPVRVRAPAERRQALLPVRTTVREAIDWSQSVAIVIGVETFVSAAVPPDVQYAADDATDFSWTLAKELPSLLPADRLLLLLSGRPDKRASQAHLLMLQHEGSVIVEEFDAERVYALISEYGEKVGQDGVLILFIATHGMTDRGAHILLMPQSDAKSPTGVELNGMLQAIPSGHGHRVLLFIDACRAPYPTPSRLFEDLRFPGEYAIFSASGPGGFARPDEELRNGYFTRAVLDGLRCRAAAANGFITPAALGAFASRRVPEASHGLQNPESRFGGLADLPLFGCIPPDKIARIVHPLPDSRVAPSDSIDVEVFVPSLYVTALVCAASTGECWKQNPEPVPATAGAITRIHAGYGDEDAFRIYAALSADGTFLRGEEHFPAVPLEHRAENIVYWLGPNDVSLEGNQ